MANFWSDAQQQDPKRKYRWILSIASVPAYVIKKVDKPGFKVTETEHKYLNHTYYYPGRVEWEAVTVTLADPVSPDMAATMANILAESGYKPAQSTLQEDTKTISKQKAVAALGNLIEIKQIDHNGDPVETWKLVNPFITDVKFGDLDYESDDMSEIVLTIRYDWAELETSEPANDTSATKFFPFGGAS